MFWHGSIIFIAGKAAVCVLYAGFACEPKKKTREAHTIVRGASFPNPCVMFLLIIPCRSVAVIPADAMPVGHRS